MALARDAVFRSRLMMTFFSHAQNFEDVMLRRALGDIVQGFYVDVGAFDPALDSVSLGFYEQGWRGVHVEPVPVLAERMRVARPDEAVLELALAAEPGSAELFVVEGTGMSSLCPDWASNAKAAGYSVSRIRIETNTLDRVKADFSQEVHWLKVDVEGAEDQVLSGWSGTGMRPWIIVIEAVAPNGRTQLHQRWEHHLTEKGYSFAYFDGLNRFYVSPEHSERAEHLRYGPSVWDEFQFPAASRRCAQVVCDAAVREAALVARCDAMQQVLDAVGKPNE